MAMVVEKKKLLLNGYLRLNFERTISSHIVPVLELYYVPSITIVFALTNPQVVAAKIKTKDLKLKNIEEIHVTQGYLKLKLPFDIPRFTIINKLEDILGFILFEHEEIQRIRDEIANQGLLFTNSNENEDNIQCLKLNDADFVTNMMNKCMQTGFKFMRHKKKGICDIRYVVFNKTRLEWKKNAEDKTERSRFIRISTITSVIIGKHNKILNHQSLKDIPWNCCVSIFKTSSRNTSSDKMNNILTLNFSSTNKDPNEIKEFTAYLKAFERHSAQKYHQLIPKFNKNQAISHEAKKPLLITAYIRLNYQRYYPHDIVQLLESFYIPSIQIIFPLLKTQSIIIRKEKNWRILLDKVKGIAEIEELTKTKQCLKLKLSIDVSKARVINVLEKRLGVLLSLSELQSIRDDITNNNDISKHEISALRLNNVDFVRNLMNVLKTPTKFIKHRKNGVKDERFVVVDKDRVYWKQNPQDRNQKSRSMQFLKMSQILDGKNTRALKHDTNKDLPSNCCFSIVAKRATLDLSSPTKSTIQIVEFIAYLRGLQRHFTNVKQELDKEKAKEEEK